MWIIIGLVVLGIIGVPIVILVLKSHSTAKKKANQWLEQGSIPDLNEYKSVSDVLSTMENDLEAADLWKRLNELKIKQYNV